AALVAHLLVEALERRLPGRALPELRRRGRARQQPRPPAGAGQRRRRLHVERVAVAALGFARQNGQGGTWPIPVRVRATGQQTYQNGQDNGSHTPGTSKNRARRRTSGRPSPGATMTGVPKGVLV